MADYSRNTNIGKYHKEETTREVLEDIIGNSTKLTKETQEESLEELKKIKTGVGVLADADLDEDS